MVLAMKKGYLWIGIGVAMIIFDIAFEPIFMLKITRGFRFPLAALALLYGVLSIVGARLAATQAELTQEEIETWGDALSKVTPRIISMSEEMLSSEVISETLEKESNIPQDIMIKYLYAMRTYLKEVQEDKRSDKRRNLESE